MIALLGALVLVEQAHGTKLRKEKALMSLRQAQQENRYLKQQAQIKQQKYDTEVKRLISKTLLNIANIEAIAES